MSNKRNFVALIILCMAVCLAGCGKQNKATEDNSQKQGTVVLKYGDNIVTKGETYIYILTVKQQYELKYGKDVWELSLPNTKEDDISMVDLTKEEVIKNIVLVKTFNKHKDQYKVSLTETEETDIKNKAEEFYKGLTDADISDMELTQELIEKVMTENAIADKVKAKLLEKNPVEISDEQARMTTFYDMYFACYSIDDSGNVNPFSKEDRQKQYDNAIQACSTLGTAKIDDDNDKNSIEKLAEYYNLDMAESKTLTPNQILETYGQEIYDMLYSMENGEYSTVVESQYGYHVFQMIALTDHKATDARKMDMYDSEVEKALEETISKWMEEIDADFSYPESVDMDVYNTINIKE